MSLPNRPIHDPRTIRAMAHPLRLRLLELLFTDGPLTASRCAEQVGESPASCSFHLRQLAKYGYVEEAGGGRGRERPWQLVPQVTEIRESELTSEASLAADALVQVLGERQTEPRDAHRLARHGYPQPWRDAAIEVNVTTFATAEELAELKRQVDALALELADRHMDPADRPSGAEPVVLIIQAFAMRPPVHRPAALHPG